MPRPTDGSESGFHIRNPLLGVLFVICLLISLGNFAHLFGKDASTTNNAIEEAVDEGLPTVRENAVALPVVVVEKEKADIATIGTGTTEGKKESLIEVGRRIMNKENKDIALSHHEQQSDAIQDKTPLPPPPPSLGKKQAEDVSSSFNPKKKRRRREKEKTQQDTESLAATTTDQDSDGAADLEVNKDEQRKRRRRKKEESNKEEKFQEENTSNAVRETETQKTIDTDISITTDANEKEEMNKQQKSDSTLIIAGTDTKPADGQSMHPLMIKSNLLQQIRDAKSNLQTKLIDIYGDYYYWNIFEPKKADNKGHERQSMGRHHYYKSPNQIVQSIGKPQAITNESLGWHRMVRMIQIKLLQVQVELAKNSMDDHHKLPSIPLDWVTSGNGQASGSGNFFRESYTAVLESALQSSFAKLGIRFTAKNYASKFTSSGDEVAYCQKQIYPSGVDIMYWDFDMTDEKDYWKLALFGHRLAIDNTTQTALIASQRTKGHTKVLAGLESRGMTVLGKDWQIQGKQNGAFPDSQALSKEQLAALPPELQYIKCGKMIEDGGPPVMAGGVMKKLCRAYKFNVTVCADRPHKYIWHPSYRTNAIRGYVLAMTLLEITEDAIAKLPAAARDPKGIQYELERLLEAQRKDYEGLQKGVPKGLGKWYEEENGEGRFHQEVDMLSLFHSPALCRTALLPSASRYLYQWHGTGKKITTPYNDTFERGQIFAKFAKEDKKRNKGRGGFRYPEKERANEMVLVTDKSGYYECKEEPLLIDHQDSFVVTSNMGWRSLTLPNDLEQQHFDTMSTITKGWIFVCLWLCDNSKCADEDLHDRVYSKRVRMDQGDPLRMEQEYGRVEMEVNGVPVTGQTVIMFQKTSHPDNCLALRHGQGDEISHTWKPRDDGTYELKARIVDGEEWAYVKFSSVILM